MFKYKICSSICINNINQIKRIAKNFVFILVSKAAFCKKYSYLQWQCAIQADADIVRTLIMCLEDPFLFCPAPSGSNDKLFSYFAS